MLPRTLLRTGLRDLGRRPLHTALMVLGVALGVAVVVAIDLANESASRGFARSTEAVGGRATHQVLGGPSGVPLSVYREIALARVAPAAPILEESGVSETLGRQGVRLLGVDPLAEGPFRDHVGAGALRTPGFGALFTRDGCLIGATAARRHGLRPGSPLRVRVGERVLDVTVLGVLHAGSPDREAGLEGLLLFDVGVLQRLLGRGDRLTRIDLVADAAQARRIASGLPPGLRLAPADEQAETVGQLSSAFQLNLGALSLLALVVGMFLIYNTVTFSVVQRRAVFGTLRALGVTPGQLFALILAETALAATAGTLLGLGLGFVLGQGAVRLVTRTINDLYYVLAVTGAPLQAASLLKGLALGVGASLLAAVPPALEAARVEPALAQRPSTYETAARAWLPRLAAAGALLAAAGAALLGLAETSLLASFAGLFAVVLGFGLGVPWLTLGLMALFGPSLSRVVGVLGRLGARTVARSVSRTGVAIAALATAVSVTIGVGLMIASFRATVVDWLEVTLVADLYVGAPSGGGVRATPSFDPALAARVAGVPGVERVEAYRRVRVDSDVGEVVLGVSDVSGERTIQRFRFADGSDPDPWARVAEGAVVVSEPFAHRHRLPGTGAAITLRTDRGPVRFPVVGVFYDYSTEEGTLRMSRAVYERHYDDRAVSSLAVYAAPTAEAAGVAEGVRAALAGTALQVIPSAVLKRQALRIFDRTFAVTNALRLLAVVVAFIGVWSALLALQAERTRELGTLQALGLTPPQLWALTLIETGLMGLAAGLLSWPLGGLLASVLVDVINVRSFGWTMRLELQPAPFAQALATSVSASLLAGVYPLLRLRRMPIAAALRQE
ncbi:MAG: FtsX-like permease family protein [Vicinamibacteria bacterium]